jgi:transcriptional regulator with XRE-family HTH domain
VAEASGSTAQAESGLGQLTDPDEFTERDRDQVVQARFGQRLKRICQDRGLNQTRLAARLGVSSARVGHWWRGENSPSLHFLSLLADALGTSTDVLLGRGPAVARSPAEEEALARLWQDILEHPGQVEVHFFDAPVDCRRVIKVNASYNREERRLTTSQM